MKKIRRILAVIGIVLLAGMYLASLLFAVFDTGKGMFLFQASMICTVLVPILLWGYTVIYRIAKGKDEQELQETLQKLDEEKKQQDK